MTREHGLMILRTFIISIAIIGLGWLVVNVFSVTYPFWIAAFIAWFLQPWIRFMKEKLKFSSGFASLFGLLAGIILVSSLLTGTLFLIGYSLRNFFQQIPQWIETSSVSLQHFFNQVIFPFWQQILGIFDTFSHEEQEALRQSIIQLGSQVGSLLGQAGQSLVDRITHVLLGVPTFLVAFLFIFLSIYFMGKQWSFYKERLRDVVPPSFLVLSRKFGIAVRARLFGFVKAQFILMLITGFIVLVGLLILKVEHALTLAVVIGIAELLPYLGTGTILIPWFVYLYITGEFSMAIGLSILYGIIVAVRQLIEPKILSSNLNLNPVAVLISLFVGLQLFGALGLLVGPVLLVLVMILNDIGVIRSIVRFIKEGWAKEA
ncbi:sporulation integral membrane protein YtvI [Alkalihalophilus lindianensis]|uniref:Sporulation integral membrane protein YtvI n=1 Tax=Alkalihalophilus lindianensis TaxID=1630542 RepID=A0ABU3X6V9_9BACI|nr:sporulation integral membrane protein YtvI [Alkalihalophilus lindianensis]MDV2683604.1 sporulation integral membrane protein YtvI [Alkalihalophilus lindianensis]